MVESVIYSSESEAMPRAMPISLASEAKVYGHQAKIYGYMEALLPLDKEPQTGTRYDDYIIVVTEMAKRLVALRMTGQPTFAVPSHTMEWFCREVSLRSERPFPTCNRLVWGEGIVTSPYHEQLAEPQKYALEEKIILGTGLLTDFNEFVQMVDISSGEGALVPLKDGTYCERLAELQSYALEEEIIPDTDSLTDFNKFVRMVDSPSKEGALFLLKDGTYRAMWRDDHWRLSLRFRGHGKIDYVLLDRTNPPDGKTGTVDFKGFANLRRRLALESLLSE